MLRIEVDVFSGRPNPVWVVTDDAETKRFLGAVADARESIAEQGAGFNGLGFREVRVDVLADDEPVYKRVPKRFALASTAAADLKNSGSLARRLIEAIPLWSKIRLVEHDLTPLTAELQGGLIERLDRYLAAPPRPLHHERPTRNPLRRTVPDNKCKECQYEVSKFNPGFWNKPAIRPRNNCYNYARNWRTDTFAQPGRAHGAGTSTMSCGAVSTAAMADGLVRRCSCLPQSEYPRRLMALVIDPGFDYHWYRHQIGGFWGHKPGQTAARNVDNSNVPIANPETCDRGDYVDFCGYFYASKSVVIN